MRNTWLICFILSSCVLLAGCWDRREINDIAFVTGTALDKDGGEYRTSHQIALPGQLGGAGSKGGGGGTSGSKSWYTVSETGVTIREAALRQQSVVPRLLYTAHRRVVLFSDELAKEGLAPVMDALGRIPQNRLNAVVLITKGPAREVLDCNVPVERLPSETARELGTSTMKQPRTIRYLVHTLLTDGVDPSLPVIELIPSQTPGADQDQTDMRVSDIAVFRESKLAGMVEGDLAKYLLLALNQARNAEYTVPAPAGAGYVMVQMQENDVNLVPRPDNGNFSMKVEIKGKATVMENESNYNLVSRDNIPALERVLNEQIESHVTEVINELQSEHKSDALGFGKTIRERLPEEWRDVAKDWHEVYPDVKVTVESRVYIEHIGAVVSPFGRKDRHLVQ
ncbi:Ger(x)C family spore germination protein [Paenibacillus xerothermodurans]|uniref:Ger(x)C family spore germination protein n=1 Tax=Paenibacillus xerothermodurans TaxID=1977292 RepID=UPI0014024BFF|nr:Ger(x)C family spore germination protein [Paenibacillus xerothermodurans]